MKPTYAGKINNQGQQYVESLYKGKQPPKGVSRKGDDLRCGKSKG